MCRGSLGPCDAAKGSKMVNPWIEWQRLMRAGTMMSETFLASQEVVKHRTKSIENAMSDPLNADHVELGLMVSEKGMAFGTAGASLARDWMAMQSDMSAQAVAIGQMMMGQVPTPRAAQEMVARGQRLGSAALASSNRAMRPIHAAATANARRLKKKR
ncbi:hypothetical protein [Sphingomonas sp. LY160]|uniref:hypothetical protein n=1 Tax=Sphingomonas sp. LY160 TaxID=3095342 RepID=UPI002ADEF5F3|nr:hypothetical protein [Sphingomonas sp. LY160]MEA1072345.1 hypothetical protein [Sphingomonas sp. LY160]